MTVLLNDTDITEYVAGNSFDLTSAKAEVGQVLINPIPSLVGIDTEGFWNPNNPASAFFGVNDYSVFTITVKDEELEIFTGSIQSIQRDSNGTAQVQLQTELQRALEKNLIYSSGGSLNPAEVFIEVCRLYKIKYDPVSTLRSSAIYELDTVRVSSDVLVPDTTLLAFFEALAQAGIASIYSVGEYLYFAVYEGGAIEYPVVTLENTYDNDALYLLSKPVMTSIQKEIPTGYSVTYRDLTLSKEDGTTTWGDQYNAFQLSGGFADLVRIDSLQTAVWLGEQWYEYLNRADTEVSTDISTELARDLQVGYAIRIEMNDNTIAMNMIVNELTKVNRVQTQLKGVAYGN